MKIRHFVAIWQKQYDTLSFSCEMLAKFPTFSLYSLLGASPCQKNHYYLFLDELSSSLNPSKGSFGWSPQWAC